MSFALRHACNIVKLSPPATAIFLDFPKFFTFSIIESNVNVFVVTVENNKNIKQNTEKLFFIFFKE